MTFGSLFAGIGGIDLGLERAGLVCRWQVEIDPFCQKILEKHWPGVPKHGDIRQISGRELEPVDLICGGYPCQPFSQAGKRAGSEDARHLWPEFARLVRVLRPQFVLLENVPGHLSLGFGSVLGDLAGLGYDAEWICLRAADFGAAHLRKRIFVVAHRAETRRAGSQDPGANPDDEGQDRRRGQEFERNGSELAYRAPGGWGERGKPSGGYGLIDGSHAQLDDAARDARDGSHGQNGPRRGVRETGDAVDTTDDHWRRGISGAEAGVRPRGIGGRGFAERCADVPDPSREGLPDTEQAELSGAQRDEERRAATELCGAFAPGPSDHRWTAILRERPDLAPALESPVRGVANGIPAKVDGALKDRTKRLKALGNAVVPQCAEWIGRQIISQMNTQGRCDE